MKNFQCAKIHFFALSTFFYLTAANSISGLKSILKKFLKDLLQYFNPYILKKFDLIDKIFLHSGPKIAMLKKRPFLGEKRRIQSCYRNERFKKQPVSSSHVSCGSYAGFVRPLGSTLQELWPKCWEKRKLVDNPLFRFVNYFSFDCCELIFSIKLISKKVSERSNPMHKSLFYKEIRFDQ